MVLSFLVWQRLVEPIQNLLATSKLPSQMVFGFPFLRFPHAFWVLGTVGHDMVVFPLSVRARPDYNPSHLVLLQIAPQILLGASATVHFCCTKVVAAFLFDNCPEICLFMFGI
jgi:hypothetical protein